MSNECYPRPISKDPTTTGTENAAPVFQGNVEFTIRKCRVKDVFLNSVSVTALGRRSNAVVEHLGEKQFTVNEKSVPHSTVLVPFFYQVLSHSVQLGPKDANFSLQQQPPQN